MITRQEILMGRDKDHPLSPVQELNLSRLHVALNEIRKAYGKPMIVTSGYRPAAINASVGGAKRSAHMDCLACDFRDTDGALDKWCTENQALLETLGLWLEHPDATKGWCHLDLRDRPKRPGPLHRTFRP